MANKSLIFVFGANTNKFFTELKKVEKGFRGLNKISDEMKDVGKKMTAGMTLPLVGMGIAAGKMSMDFNKSMANVATLIPGNVGRVKELKKSVQDMAIEVGKRTGDLAEGLYQVVSAFGDSADTAQILNINARAATAGLATTLDAINLTSAVTKGYGDTTAKAVQQASDLAFQTVKLGQTTFPELAAAIGTVVPLAATLGIKQAELFAGFATLTGVTGPATEVSTQLAAIQQAMIKPTTDMTEAIKNLGYSSAQTLIEELGLVGGLRELIGTTDGTQESVAKLFGRAEALTAVFALTGGQAEVFDQKLAQLRNSAGATEEAFKEQTDGVNKAGFAWEQMISKLEVAAHQIGDRLAPAFSQLIDRVSKAVSWFTSLSDGTQNTIINMAALAAALGPVVFIAGTFVGAITKLIALKTAWATASAAVAAGTAATGATAGIASPLVMGLGAAFRFMLGPVGLVITAIAGAIAVGVLLYKNWDTIKENAAITWRLIAEAIKGPANAIIGFTNGIIGAFEKMLNSVASAINRIPRFEIPDWVPKIGGRTFGMPKIPEISLPKIPLLAAGGRALSPGSVLVGEEGPEILSLPRGAQVAPLGGSAGGAMFVYNQNAPVYGVLDFKQKIVEAWAEARRGGAFRGMMGE